MSENTIAVPACEAIVELVTEQPTTDSTESIANSLRTEDKMEVDVSTSLDARDNPYAYLDRDDFTSEKFKIEIRGLPKYYGIGELKKLLNEKMNLESNKLKPPRRGSPWIYVCFRSEEDRSSALKSINGFTWKNSVLSATVAQPAQDPLIKKRKLMENNEEDDNRSKQSKVDTRSQEERLKSSVTPFWDVPYEEQARRKEEVIRQMLVKLGKDLVRENPVLKPWIEEQRAKHNGMPCEVWNIRKSPILDGYRNKCEFTVGKDEETGKRTVGFRLGSYVHGFLGVGPVDALAHVPQRMKDAVHGFEEFVRASEYEVYNPETQGGHWRQLTARLSFATDQLMLVVGVDPQNLTGEQLDKLKEDLKEFFSEGEGKSCNVSSLYFETMVKKQSGGEVPPLEHLSGETHIHENLCGLKFRISPEAFFQVNTPAAEVLYDTAFEISSPSPDTTVIDICCGTGTIGLCLAKRCDQVLGLELQKQAVDDAKANATNNGITNSDFFAGRAEEILSSVMNRATQKNVLAIVDPPRAGLHRKAVVMLRRTAKLNKLVFLSCDPRAALQNFIDLGRPTSKMYHGIPLIPIRAVPVDLFPHTKHCELIVYFERFGQQAETTTFDLQPSLDKPLPEVHEIL